MRVFLSDSGIYKRLTYGIQSSATSVSPSASLGDWAYPRTTGSLALSVFRFRDFNHARVVEHNMVRSLYVCHEISPVHFWRTASNLATFGSGFWCVTVWIVSNKSVNGTVPDLHLMMSLNSSLAPPSAMSPVDAIVASKSTSVWLNIQRHSATALFMHL